LIELIDELEGVHSDEVKANIAKRMDKLQKEVPMFDSSTEGGISSITKKVKATIDDIRDDIHKGVKK
jgi:predicted unusual protein kinase regulating ubiquinone biosynthesis (AarF/ABC1/UbiB family)